MAFFKFIGDPRHGGQGPDRIVVLGLSFDRLHATEVADARAIAKLAGNPHFEQVEVESAPMREASAVQAAPATGTPAAKQSRKRKARRAAEGAA